MITYFFIDFHILCTPKYVSLLFNLGEVTTWPIILYLAMSAAELYNNYYCDDPV